MEKERAAEVIDFTDIKYKVFGNGFIFYFSSPDYCFFQHAGDKLPTLKIGPIKSEPRAFINKFKSFLRAGETVIIEYTVVVRKTGKETFTK